MYTPAFTAVVSNDLNYPNEKSVVEFHDTLSNIGNHFQLENSIFICPYNGTYAFFLNILNDVNALASVDLMQDGVRLVPIWADGREIGHNGISTSAIVKCVAGSEIWSESNVGNIMIRGANYSVVSGYLISRN